jgi:hypothetical protein
MRKESWTKIFDSIDYGPEQCVGYEFRYEGVNESLQVTWGRNPAVYLRVDDRETWFKGREAECLIDLMEVYFSMRHNI